MNPATLLCRLPAFCAFVTLGSWAVAQTAPAPSPTAATAATKDEAVVLSPFEVNSGNDRGYQAANTLGATRTNVAIRDLPMQINVITEQLMIDRALRP